MSCKHWIQCASDIKNYNKKLIIKNNEEYCEDKSKINYAKYGRKTVEVSRFKPSTTLSHMKYDKIIEITNIKQTMPYLLAGWNVYTI